MRITFDTVIDNVEPESIDKFVKSLTSLLTCLQTVAEVRPAARPAARSAAPAEQAVTCNPTQTLVGQVDPPAQSDTSSSEPKPKKRKRRTKAQIAADEAAAEAAAKAAAASVVGEPEVVVPPPADPNKEPATEEQVKNAVIAAIKRLTKAGVDLPTNVVVDKLVALTGKKRVGEIDAGLYHTVIDGVETLGV